MCTSLSAEHKLAIQLVQQQRSQEFKNLTSTNF